MIWFPFKRILLAAVWRMNLGTGMEARRAMGRLL